MARYRIYAVTTDGRITAPPIATDCNDDRAAIARAAALDNELLLRPIGRTVYLMPPYILGDDETELLAARTRKVFEQVMGA